MTESVNKAYEYIKTNRDMFPTKQLKKQLKKAGYKKQDIDEAVSRAGADSNDKEKGLLKKMFKKTKPKQVPVLFLRNNNNAEVMKVTPKDGMLEIDGRKYHPRQGANWNFKEGMQNKQGYIIPEWGMYPFGPEEYLKELKSEEAGVQYDIVRAIQTAETIRMAEEKQKGKINPKIAVLIAIGAIVALYFILGA